MSQTNIWIVEPFVRASLDPCAFVAITPSSSTLDGLIEMVESDNKRVRRAIDADVLTNRSLFVSARLVARHPCRMLILSL